MTKFKKIHNRYEFQVLEMGQFIINYAALQEIYLQLAEHLKKIIERQFDAQKPLPIISAVIHGYAVLNRINLVYWAKEKGFFVKSAPESN